MRTTIYSTFFVLSVQVFLFTSVNSAVFQSPHTDDAKYWRKYAEDHLQKVLKRQGIKSVDRVKNVIYFVGDGMSVATIAAGRIYKGQLCKNSGEETDLVFESFPHLGMAKTYNIDRQVPDSAGTATALFTGVKAAYTTIGLNPASEKSTHHERLHSIMDWAQAAKKRTGEICHATPAGTYAYSPNRNYECDSKVPEKLKRTFKDISRQLVENSPGKNLNVIFGGGRDFMGATIEERTGVLHFNGSAEISCNRTDGINLPQQWLKNRENATYVTNTGELADVDYENIDQVMGLFANNHMSYNAIRNKESDGEPSLTEMTKAAIRILDNKRNENGFVLMVEGGKIDQAHHQNLAKMALEEFVEFERAIQEAINMSTDDTLIVVTSDHAHSMIFNGYGVRGNDILEFGNKVNETPYETLVYATGPGYYSHHTNQTNQTWIPVESMSGRNEPKYAHLSAIPMSDAVHSGEDVAVFATGKGSNLIQGIFEQNYIAFCISYAACIGPVAHKNPQCSKNYRSNSNQTKSNLLVFMFFQTILIFRMI
ncbi:unnamed protein product [Diamesa hyperborea]